MYFLHLCTFFFIGATIQPPPNLGGYFYRLVFTFLYKTFYKAKMTQKLEEKALFIFNIFLFVFYSALFNRPGVAGAVLQSPMSFIN